MAYAHVHTHTHTLFGILREGKGGGVEVKTDHFGIKVAAAADMKSSSEPVGQQQRVFVQRLQNRTRRS